MNLKLLQFLNDAAQTGVFKILTIFFARYFVYIIVAMFVVWTLVRLPRQLFFYGLIRTCVALVLALGLSVLVGMWMQTPRPYVTYDNIKPLYEPSSSWKAFPSDHTAGIFVLSASAALLGLPWLSIILALLGVIVGGTRVAAGLHYPIDILGGAFLGWFVGAVTGMIAQWMKK